MSINFGGRELEAYEKESLGAALWANGIKILSRSFKFHRPRGLFCVSGNCPNCLMRVNGVPNLRVCVEKAHSGDKVEGQNCWPSLRRDLFRAIDYVSSLFPTGFQYRRFIRPRFLWPLYAKVIRNLAGIGKLPDRPNPPKNGRRELLQPDVLVIGGGIAGMSAALSAASAGAQVILVDEQDELGGRLAVRTSATEEAGQYSGLRGFEISSAIREQVTKRGAIRTLQSTTAFGFYEDGVVLASSADALYRIRAKSVVVCTGGYELPFIFDNNDLPGIMLSSGAENLMHKYGVKPGRTAVVAGFARRAFEVARELSAAGVSVSAVISPDKNRRPLDFTGRVLEGCVVRSAIGGTSLQAVRVAHLGNGEVEELKCDVLCLASAFRPANELLLQIGCEVSYEPESGGVVPLHDGNMMVRSGVYAAGEAAGTEKTVNEILLEGELAGLSAAKASGRGDEVSQDRMREIRDTLKRGRQRQVHITPVAEGGKSIACFCLDVLSSEVAQAVRDGHDDIETLKRFTAMTMGPCQGKQCLYALIGLLAAEKNLQPGELAVPTQRPPVRPVRIGLLAGAIADET